ncbi:MAG: efflux transporter outer membrane subunit [Desulfobacterales bacterium]|nr:efflux transporter outer membrane subunit [Desulfobacterales bacterium]
MKIKIITKQKLQKFIIIGLLFTFVGCSAVGQDYRSPDIKMDFDWQLVADPAILPRAVTVRKWWTLFNDPLLNRLIETASKSNLDLLSVIARVEETRARLGVVTGDYLPSVDVSGSAMRGQSSENNYGTGNTDTFYANGIGASWEIDLFGRIRRSVEAAKAQYQASEEDRTDVMISLYSSVSLTYLEIRTNQARLKAAKSNIESRKGLLVLTKSRLEHGLATELDLAQAKSLLAIAEAGVPPLRLGISRGINNLAVLLGKRPGTLHEELLNHKLIPLPPSKVTVGVPADLLRQRPDIRKAERILAAQTARIGVEKSALYPSFSLTGSFGFESIDAGDLFDAGSQVFSFGPSLRWNIFSRGKIRNLIKAQDAVTRQSLFKYEQTVLNGLREVENNLKAYVEDRIRLAALERAVKAAKHTVRLARDLYKQGLVNFQPVLDAQRDQFNFENQMAVAKGDSAANFVRLYASLGGGWDPKQPKKAIAKNSIKPRKEGL